MTRSVGIYFLSRVLTAGLGLAAVAVFTRLGSPEIYGTYTLVLTAATTIFAVCFHWIQSGILRFLPGEDPARPRVLGTALVGYGGVALLLAPALLGIAVVAPDLGPPRLWPLVGGLALAYAAMEITLGVVHARQRPGTYALMLLTRAAASLALGSLLLVLGHGAAGLLFGVLVAHAAPVAAVAWRWRRRLVSEPADRGTLRRMAAFGLPLGLVGLAAAVIGISDRYMLAALVGVDAAGTYAAPYDLAQRSLQILLLAAFLAASPAIFRHFENGDQAALQDGLLQQARLMLLTVLPAATIMAAAAPLVARLLFGEAFRDAAAALIPIIVVATLVQGVQSYYFSYCFTLAQRTLANAALVFAGAIVNVALNLLLIPAYGATGAAFATLASLVVVLIGSLVVTRRWMVLPWPAADSLRSALACLVAAAPIALAARLEEPLPAVAATALASFVLLLLLLAFDVASLRTLLGHQLQARRRRLIDDRVSQP